MYIPKPFAMNDPNEQLAFIRSHPFGILISTAQQMQATHVPFVILEAGKAQTQTQTQTLGLHVAKANPQWQRIHDQEVLCIFTGDHAFVSASWYQDKARSVPTWDYTAVHVYGKATIATDGTRERILRQLTKENEPEGGWSMDQADPAYLDANRKAIVAIEVAVHKIEGVKKLSQNRTDEDRERVAAHLEAQAAHLAASIRAGKVPVQPTTRAQDN